MAKFDHTQLSLKQRQKITAPLVEALFRLKKREQVEQFLSRLLTPSEFVMLGRRMLIADKLVRGKSYETIRKEAGVGFSTIRNVDSWLEHAVRDYHDIRAEQKHDEKEKQRLKNWKPSRRFARSDFIILELLADSLTSTHLKSRK